MNAANNPVAPCKLDAATAAAVAACDGIDGVKDGVIEDPKRCSYDPKALVGTSAGECGAFTEADATIIRKMWEGPRKQDGTFMWYGLPRGADLKGLWTSRGTPLRPVPFGISMDWYPIFPDAGPEVRRQQRHARRATSASGINPSSSTAPCSAPTTRT